MYSIGRSSHYLHKLLLHESERCFTMRVVLGVAFIAMVLADDKSFCMIKCAEKYPEGEIRMSVKYSNDGKPDVKIVRNNNGVTSVERPALSGASDIDRFISSILGDVNRQILPIHNPASAISDDRNPTREDGRNSDLFESAHARMMAMQNRMNEMLAAFSRHFFDGIRRRMQHERHVAIERPSEHDAYAHIGPEIGNILSNGDPIISTHPVDGAEDSDAKGRSVKVVRYQMSSNHPPSVFYWIMIAFGVGALLLTLYASVIFFRVMRSAAYRRISSDGTGRCPVAPSGPGPLPVKKVPLDGWVERSEPSGVPPPAYDQVSIHSVQKQKQTEEAQQPQAAHPESSSPSNDQN
ncbi:hypothetical protein TELCIR_11910 [Teladorsagia circumcincta]|uniref:Uncharacterized protein n=1 Tax=Teladorsagia circumcincta TaxID=45464 RepID=A0A2G9UA71_TELCI|nr:hypothetical protein TELCIR_11910 [Teladorsagia circumcincta]